MEDRPDTDAIVEQWFVDRVHNSPASRDPVLYAHLRSAADELKQRLRGDAPLETGTAADTRDGRHPEGEE